MIAAAAMMIATPTTYSPSSRTSQNMPPAWACCRIEVPSVEPLRVIKVTLISKEIEAIFANQRSRLS
jgi:hypothetical protein